MAYLSWNHTDDTEVMAYHVYWAPDFFDHRTLPETPVAKVMPPVKEVSLPEITSGYLRVGIEVKGQIRVSADITKVTGEPINEGV